MKRLLALATIAGVCMASSTFAEPAPATAPAPAKDMKPAVPPAPKTDAKSEMKKDAKPAATGAPDPKAMEEAMEAAGKPGEFHKWMEQLEGKYDAVVKEMGFDGKWTEENGEMTNKMVFGGRYLEMSFKGRSQGKFFYGFGTMGYNNSEKKFVSTWYDSMSTDIARMTGTADAAGKVVTLTGEMTDPASGKKIMMRDVLTVTGKDSYKQEFYMPMNGTDTKMMEITYAKGKAKAEMKPADKPADKAAEKPADKKPTK